MAVGAAVTIVGSLVPWLRTGDRTRNSFDLFRIVNRLGFAPDGPGALAIRWWPLVPLLAAVSLVAAWWGWPRAGGAMGVVAALYAGGVALAVASAPGTLGVTPAPFMTATGAAVLLVGSVGAAVAGVGTPARSASITTSTDRDGSTPP
jgi:hypothetical protein